jgi:hypothetical protein
MLETEKEREICKQFSHPVNCAKCPLTAIAIDGREALRDGMELMCKRTGHKERGRWVYDNLTTGQEEIRS